MTPSRLPGCALLLFITFLTSASSGQGQGAAEGTLGYYRFPALHNDTLLFTAEGDLWQVGITGGTAQRLTTHPAEESRPALSPDGKTVAFSAAYEGPTEVYTLPLDGGIPTRQTFDGATAQVMGWTPGGEVLYATRRFSTLPNTQLVRVDPRSGTRAILPLAQASDGSYDPRGATLFFTRFAFQGSYTKRYVGGTAQNIWRFTDGKEAAPLTADYKGTSKHPMPWNGRVYFLSDRDGHMNLWSMAEAGGDVRQHTRHDGLDAQSPSLSNGRIAYQLGPDIRVFEIAANQDRPVPIRLVSDFDQLRERWVRTPMEWVTGLHLSPTGDRIVLNARGQLFVAPAQQGRIAEATRDKKIRYRMGRFFPDGKTLLTLGDATGEVEFWRAPANGVGDQAQLTGDAKVLRWDGIPSPDGNRIAHYDKDQQLWIYDIPSKRQTQVAKSEEGGFDDVRWSPDGRWLAYTAPATNQMTRLFLHDVQNNKSTPVTTDRYDSYSPEFSPDGKWLYFLSDRNFVSIVQSPWGSRQPEPYFDKQTKIFHVSMKPGERSPFQPDDELYTAPASTEKPSTEKPADKPANSAGKDSKPAAAQEPKKPETGPGSVQVKPIPPVPVDLAGIETRLVEVPLPAGNYASLGNDGKRLYFMSTEAGATRATLRTLPIENKGPRPETFMEEVASYELSQDRKKILVRKGTDIFVFDVGAKAPQDTTKNKVPLTDWSFRLDPRDEWRQMFTEAWRLERDYFYDRGMHGIDWPAMKAKYLPMVERVTDRAELSDILAQMVGELSALHIFVRGGDIRRGQDQVTPGSLGAVMMRDDKAGGYRVDHIYRSDPDIPDELAPLARVGVNVSEGDIIEAVNGVPALSARDISALLRDQANKQVLLRVKPKAGGSSRDVVVTPITLARENDLRYDEWEYTRRLQVERATKNRMGYVHLRAMGGGNMTEWQREFYPVFDREGLIIDVRHNNGGNIDSWILEKLLRKAWFFWQPRVGNPTWNMQYAFRGHAVVLVDESTASDGEAFAEGFRRLGLGKVIGTRTWGGEIWLSQNNFLVDRGIATAAETGVFGPDGDWLIEGHGVDPDIVVDNLPHDTFKGRDAQLEAAIRYLEEELKKKPIPKPVTPRYPDKSFKKRGG